MRLMVLRRIDQKGIAWFSRLVPLSEMSKSNQSMIASFSRLEIPQLIRTKFFLVEKSNHQINTFGRAALARPNYWDKAKCKLGSVVKLLFRYFYQLRTYLWSFLNNLPYFFDRDSVLRFDDIAGVDTLPRQRNVVLRFSWMKPEGPCHGSFWVRDRMAGDCNFFEAFLFDAFEFFCHFFNFLLQLKLFPNFPFDLFFVLVLDHLLLLVEVFFFDFKLSLKIALKLLVVFISQLLHLLLLLQNLQPLSLYLFP